MNQDQIYGQTGPANYPDGVSPILQAGRQGELLVSELHAKYYSQCYRGNTFVMDSDSVTIAAANATKGALATVKLINGFFNPAGSGKNAVILMAKVATVSGTPAGPFLYNFLADSTISSASTGTIRSLLLGSVTVSSVLTPQTQVVLTNVAGGTTALKQLGVMGGPAAIAAGAGLYAAEDNVDGKIIVPPGVVFGICALTTGTSHIVQSTLMWEEVPI